MRDSLRDWSNTDGMTWRLKLLGTFELTGPEGPAVLSSHKLSALLAYLALSARPVPREQAASLLWGSHFDEQAKQNMRQALVRLRKLLGPDMLLSNDNTLQLSTALVVCDVHEFERLAGLGTIDGLRSAVSLCHGRLLSGISVRENSFEEWLAAERRRLDALACEALVKLAGMELDQGQAAGALRHAEACISLDHFREDAHRLAMRALTALGRRAEAVRHYHDLELRLKRELDTEPERSTATMYETVRATEAAPAIVTVTEPARQLQGSKKPSLAVLAFTNLSNDPEQDFMAEGISEDLIAEISKFRSLFVISRNSSFCYKGTAVGPREISAKLGARYLVDGSVRRAGNRLRITAKLVDAIEDQTLWAEHYDRQLKDIFDIQDEVIRAIVSAIEPQLLSNERNRALRKPPENLDAWEAYQRGLWQMFRYRREDRSQALDLFRRSIALDPGFASAHAGLALALYVYALLGCSPDPGMDLAEATAAANTAIDLDEFDSFGYAALARCCIITGKPQAGLAAADRSIRLNPSYAMAHFSRGHALWHQGRPQDALASLDEAMQLSPLDPAMWSFMASRAIALLLAGNIGEAIECSRHAQQQSNAAIFAHVAELCGLGLQQRHEDAADAIRRARVRMPDASVSFFDRVLPITSPPCRETLLKGLRQAGLPE